MPITTPLAPGPAELIALRTPLMFGKTASNPLLPKTPGTSDNGTPAPSCSSADALEPLSVAFKAAEQFTQLVVPPNGLMRLRGKLFLLPTTVGFPPPTRTGKIGNGLSGN